MSISSSGRRTTAHAYAASEIHRARATIFGIQQHANVIKLSIQHVLSDDHLTQLLVYVTE